MEYFVYSTGETMNHALLFSYSFFFGQQILIHFKVEFNFEIKKPKHLMLIQNGTYGIK